MSDDAARPSRAPTEPPSALTGGLPRFIHDLRVRTGLTQEKFAARLGVTFPTINRWENGRAKPSPLAIRQIEKLARHLNKSEPESE